MTTLAELIERVTTDQLHATNGVRRNKLSASLDASTESFVLSRPLSTIGEGSRLSVNLEDMSVWTTTPSSGTVEVDRGEYGTTAASHAAGDVVYVDPPYSKAQVLRALNAGVSRLMADGIYQVTTVEITTTDAVFGYDLTSSTDFLEILNVWEEARSTSTKTWIPFHHWAAMTDANVSDFASGTSLQINAPLKPGVVLRVQYRHELSPTLSALDDVVETVTGLETDAMGLLSVAAARYLLAGKEAQRNQLGAGAHRRPEDVPPGAWTQTPANLRREYDELVKAERARLALKHPRPLRARSPLVR